MAESTTMNIILATLLACTTTDDTAAYVPYAGDTGLVTAAPYLYEWASWLCYAPSECIGEGSSNDCVFTLAQGQWDALAGVYGSETEDDLCVMAEEARECIAWLHANPLDETCSIDQPENCYTNYLLHWCAL